MFHMFILPLSLYPKSLDKSWDENATVLKSTVIRLAAITMSFEEAFFFLLYSKKFLFLLYSKDKSLPKPKPKDFL